MAFLKGQVFGWETSMAKEFWTVAEVIEYFQIDEEFLVELEAEDIVCPTCAEDPPSKIFSVGEMEKLRLVKILMEEMGVNLPGVEVILRMRQNMIEMRRQFDTILEDVGRRVQKALRNGE
jgi:MerR family transcriptional regulator/heat shock protein HspR